MFSVTCLPLMIATIRTAEGTQLAPKALNKCPPRLRMPRADTDHDHRNTANAEHQP